MSPASRTEPAAWRPSASLDALRARAAALGRIRAFFARAGVLEVETPALSRHATTDPSLTPFATRYRGPGHARGLTLYLHTSPEFPMKRLLAAGSGPVYQICRVFRNAERGPRHSPEFSLLEWYRPGFRLEDLMDEVAALVQTLAGRPLAVEHHRYGALFREHLGLDPHRADSAALAAAARAQGLEIRLEARDAWLDLLMSHCIEPRLPADRLCFVRDYPASQAALARIRAGDPPVAERFELFLGGMELANGFHELADPREQRRRFEEENRRRRQALPLDTHLLAALDAGLPDCSGVALGLDRLLMWLLGEDRIERVQAFAFEDA